MPKKKTKPKAMARMISEVMSELGKQSGKNLGAAGRKKRAQQAAAARWAKAK
jgi:hypothetical protein